MHWLAQQPFTNRTTQFVAGTKLSGSSRYYDSDGDDEDSWGESDEIDEKGNVIVDFDTYWAKAMARDKHKKLRFTPSEGTHYFWFNGRPLAFIREKEENKNGGGGGYYGYGGKAPERLYISCMGRDPKLLKELLIETQRSYVAKDSHNTVIYRGQKSGGYTEWSRCMARAPRALSTVVLDQEQKSRFIGDIKEYLHPRTRRWYSNRGIPYRRGYLLHGPPGTGKTSLCFAAAGLLGLELYLLNLSSKSLDEDELMALFAELPRRCIVLLEDVDCAGMSQKRSTEDGGSNEEPARVAAPAEENTAGPSVLEKQGVSLSGLLNVIDGVAACEGRILVMTTNHPEKLDPALVRPGRIDLSIAFGYSTAADIKELFSAIYSTLEGDLRASHTERLSRELQAKIKANQEKFPQAKKDLADAGKFAPEKVSLWAERFAQNVPEGEFSPAEIQGYLLHHKTDPEGAIEGARKWVVETREKKAKIAKGEVLVERKGENGEKNADAKSDPEKVEEKKSEEQKPEEKKSGESEETEDKADKTPNGIINGTGATNGTTKS
ncbi:BCS1 N terminal-domain-containing protein [Aspergillus crustosus]